MAKNKKQYYAEVEPTMTFNTMPVGIVGAPPTADNTVTRVAPVITKEEKNKRVLKRLQKTTEEHVDFVRDDKGNIIKDAQGNPVYIPAKGTTYGDNGRIVAGAILAPLALEAAGTAMATSLPIVGNVGNALTYAAAPQAAWNAAQGDYTDAALLATPYLFKGLKAAPSVLKNAKQEFIYNAIDPLGYGAVEKIKRIPSTFFQNVTDAAGRPYRIGTNFDSQLMDNVEKASVLGKKRLDSWRVGLQLPQKYGTFTKVGPDTYTINNMEGLDPKTFSGLWNDIRAHKFNSSNNMYTGENPLVALSEEYEKLSTPSTQGEYGNMNIADMKRYLRKKGDLPQLEAWKQGRIVENAKDPNFQWSVYDNDGANGIMGGYRWDVNKTPTGQLQFKYNDTWDLHPWATRGQTVMIDPNDAWAVNFHNLNRSKDVFKPLQNVEALGLLGGKPFNVQGEFIVDPKTMKILNNYQGLSQHKNGGWLNKYK